MYKKVTTDMNFVEREKATKDFWEENHIFEKSMKNREGCETYTFYDGPPTANGKPHIGHVLTRVIKVWFPLPDHEGKICAPEGRMGYPRTAGGAGGGEASRPQRKGSD